MSSLLLYGKAGLMEFSDSVVNRPEVQEMIARVHFGIDPVAEAAGYNRMTTILELRLRDGRTVKDRTDFTHGSPAMPMTYEEVAVKFLDCAAFAKWPDAKARAVVELVRQLETVTNVKTLTSLLGA